MCPLGHWGHRSQNPLEKWGCCCISYAGQLWIQIMQGNHSCSVCLGRGWWWIRQTLVLEKPWWHLKLDLSQTQRSPRQYCVPLIFYLLPSPIYLPYILMTCNKSLHQGKVCHPTNDLIWFMEILICFLHSKWCLILISHSESCDEKLRQYTNVHLSCLYLLLWHG